MIEQRQVPNLYYEEISSWTRNALREHRLSRLEKVKEYVEHYVENLSPGKKFKLKRGVLGLERERKLLSAFLCEQAHSFLSAGYSEYVPLDPETNKQTKKADEKLTHLSHRYVRVLEGVEGYFSVYQFHLRKEGERNLALAVMGSVFDIFPFFYQKSPHIDVFEFPDYEKDENRKIKDQWQIDAIARSIFFEAGSIPALRTLDLKTPHLKNALRVFDKIPEGMKGLAQILEIPESIAHIEPPCPESLIKY